MKKTLETIISPATFSLYQEPPQDRVVVVIDILRATTTLCMAFAHGIDLVIPVSSVEEAKNFQNQGYLLAAERNAQTVEGFSLGNSPQEYTEERVKGKRLVLTTTNGTRALHMASSSKEVLIGSFLNQTALVSYLEQSPYSIQLFCAGWKDKFNLEDTLFAGAVGYALSKDIHIEDDATLAAIDLYLLAARDMESYLSKSSHVKRFKTLHTESDVAVCLKKDYTSLIPKYQEGVIKI